MRSRSTMAVVLSGGGQNMPVSKTGRKSKPVYCIIHGFLPPVFEIISEKRILKLLEEHSEITIYRAHPLWVPIIYMLKVLYKFGFATKILRKVYELNARRWGEWRTIVIEK